MTVTRFSRFFPALAFTLALVGVGVGLYNKVQETRMQPSGRLYVADTFGDDVGVIDAVTGQKLTQIPTAKLPHNFAITRDHKTLFVTESGSQSVMVIDTGTNTRLRQRIVGPVPDIAPHREMGLEKVAQAKSCKTCHLSRPVGTFISGIALSPDEKEVLVTEMKTGRLLVADAQDLATKRRVTMDTPTPSTPSNVIYHPLTGDVYVFARMMTGHPGVVGVAEPPPKGSAYGGTLMDKVAAHTGVGQVTHLASGRGGFDHDPRGPGSSYIVVYDPTLTTVKATIAVPYAVPYQGVFSPDGRELYVTYRSTDKVAVIDTQGFKLLRSYTVEESPIGMVLAPDDDTLAVACFYETPATVVFMDRHTGTIKHRLTVPSSPILLRKHPKNGLLYMTASGDNKIVEIDPRIPKVLRTFDTGAYPVDLELVP